MLVTHDALEEYLSPIVTNINDILGLIKTQNETIELLNIRVNNLELALKSLVED